MKQTAAKSQPKSYRKTFLQGTFPYQVAPKYKRAQVILILIWAVIFWVHHDVPFKEFLLYLVVFLLTFVAMDYLFFWRAKQKR